MKKITFIILLSLISSIPATAASVPKPGTNCPKAGLTQTVAGKKFTCIRLGSKLYWNNGVKVASKPVAPTPTPAPSAKAVNEYRGLLFRQDKAGTVYVTILLQEIASGKYFLGSDLNQWTTPFKRNFNEQDVFRNSILGCPSGAGCLQSTFKVEQNGTTATEISFASLSHPGNFAAPMLKEADFGKDENTVIAHIKFNSIDGASDVIVRYDLATKIMSPIFVTYCKASTSKICSSGASISGLRVAHKSGNIYFILNTGLLDVNNTDTNQFLVSLSTDAPQQIIKSASEAGNKLWDGDIKEKFIYEHTDISTTIDDVGVSTSEEYVFLATRGKGNVDINNGFCRVKLSNRERTCAQLEPFEFINSIINLDDNSFVYEANGIRHYDILSRKSSPVYNTSLSTWLLDLTK